VEEVKASGGLQLSSRRWSQYGKLAANDHTRRFRRNRRNWKTIEADWIILLALFPLNFFLFLMNVFFLLDLLSLLVA
jgi:hypothetical protein